MNISPKDYIYASGFYAAVISAKIEENRVLTTVRYFQDESGGIKKLNTVDANTLLNRIKPDYLYHARDIDALVHGIPVSDIETVIRARNVVESLSQLDSLDDKQFDAIEAYQFLLQSGIDKGNIGLTGSLALGLQNKDSDIDLVIYGRENFNLVRQWIADAMHSGQINGLDDKLWQDAYERRDCELDYNSYVFHERRKFNKFSINTSKVDVSLVLSEKEQIPDTGPYKKMGQHTLRAKVVDDSQVFDLPARYHINDEAITEVVCYTVTYAGQAFFGEKIEASGIIEMDSNGDKRLVVGTSREGPGEYIKVVQ